MFFHKSMKEPISPQQLLQPSEKIFVTGYSVVEKEDVFESIIAQVVEIQKDLGIYDADDDIEINIENKDDLRFINSLRNAYACYVLEGNRKVITSHMEDGYGHTVNISFKDLQDKRNQIPVSVTYLCDKGSMYMNPEYGLDYDREPKYETITIHPNVDILDLVEKLQEQFDRNDRAELYETIDDERGM